MRGRKSAPTSKPRPRRKHLTVRAPSAGPRSLYGAAVFNKQGGTYQDKVQDGIPGIWPTKDHGALANKEEGFFVKGPVGPRAPNNYLVRAYNLVWPNAVRIVDANIN